MPEKSTLPYSTISLATKDSPYNSKVFTATSGETVVALEIGLDEMSAAGDNFVVVRGYHSPDWDILTEDNIANAMWFELTGEEFRPVAVHIGDSFDVDEVGEAASYRCNRTIRGRFRNCKLTAELKGSGGQRAVINAWKL